MLTPVFSFVFMATGLQKCLSSEREVITLACVQYTPKWLNWFKEITLLMLQKGSMALHQIMITSNSIYQDVRNIVCYLEYLQ